MSLKNRYQESPANDLDPEAAGLDDDLAALVDGMRITQDFLMRGESEWALMAASTRILGTAQARLDNLRLNRFGPGDVGLKLTVSGLTPAASRSHAQAIQREDGVVLCRVEHTLLRSERR